MVTVNETLWKFLLAGVSNMSAAAVTNPIDVIKTRLQLDNELVTTGDRKALSAFQNRYYRGFFRGGLRIVQEEGVRGLYKGLVASLLREGSYSTIRLGAYEPFKRLYGATDPAHTPLWKKILAGATSGAIGSALATPTDLVKVRQQAEGPNDARRHHRTLYAFFDLYRAGGFRALYVGLGPTVQRAAVLTATQIPTYDHTKHSLLNAGLMTEGIPLHIVSSMVAGFTAALTTSPIDIVKTRVMNQHLKNTYHNSFDCVVKTLRTEGLLGFYKGFIPTWMRIGPHTIITFFIFEQLRRAVGISPI
ncbi:Mitochondrial substrate carrier family protein ucpB [Lamellibrachia satsuma]|nr:Mitochondrial substrate carrier family protein ucpB [Lamellibrachia satsuma]